MEDFNNSSYRYNGTDDLNSAKSRQEAEANGMAKASKICGVLAVVSIFTLMIYPAIVLGAIAIILALLSRGSSSILSDRARTGLTTGIIAIIINIGIVAAAVFLIFSDGPFKNELNSMCKEVYGQTFDDMIEDAKDGSLDLDYYNLPINN